MKLIAVSQKTFAKLLKLARSRGASNLAEEVHQSLVPWESKIGRAAQEKASKAGKVLLSRSHFKNLARAAGRTNVGGTDLISEIRSTRGKKPLRSTTDEFGTTRTKLRKGGGNLEPKKVYRSEEEDMLAFNRAEERRAARTGQKISRYNDPESQFYL